MHALENYAFLQSRIYRRRGDHRTADILMNIAGNSAYYIPEGEEPATILQLNLQLMQRVAKRELEDDTLDFIRRKRRTTMAQLRAWYLVREQPEPDENYEPINYRRLQRALTILMRCNLVRRYSRGGYEPVPARER